MGPFHVEVPWLIDNGRDVREITISGRVDGDTVTEFAAVDESGRPFEFPADYMHEAHADLVDAAKCLWGAP